MNFKQAEKFIVDLGFKFDGANNKKRVKYFLRSVGNPGKKLKVIQVVGTAGKGSVCAFLSSVLQSLDFKVGLFTSPHLQTILERIQVNSKLISKTSFARLANDFQYKLKMRKISEKLYPSFFEFLTVMALRYFEEQKVDFAVMETGLGGSYDSVTLSCDPKYFIYTPIGLDHTIILGKTISKIARDKVGAIKKNSVVVTNNTEKALRIIQKKCFETRSELIKIERGRNILPQRTQRNRKEHEALCYDDGCLRIESIELGLKGEYQVYNAELALRMIVVLNPRLKPRVDGRMPGIEDEMRRGLENAFIPGRFELVSKNPTIILDGAHAPMKMKSFVQSLVKYYASFQTNHERQRTQTCQHAGRFVFVVGFKAKKNAIGMLKYIIPHAKEIYIVGIKNEHVKWQDPDKIKIRLDSYLKKQKIKLRIRTFSSGLDIVKKIRKMKKYKKEKIVVTGSLYLVGEVRELFCSREEIEKKRRVCV